MTFGIVGLGLMGGSFGKALKKYNLAINVYGYDHNKVHQSQALELGLVDKICTLEELKKCDVIILAIPVDGIIAFMQHIKDIDINTTVIDLGSTKEIIVPISALKITTDGIFVFTLDELNMLTQHKVAVGSIVGSGIIVFSGITSDMEIVLDARGLQRGQEVVIK